MSYGTLPLPRGKGYLVSTHFSFHQQLSIWRYITNLPTLELGVKFTNPCRPDTHPGCLLRASPDGAVMLTDYAYPLKYNRYTCVHAVADLMGDNYMNGFRTVYEHLSLGKPIRLTRGVRPSVMGQQIKRSRLRDTEILLEPFVRRGTPTYRQVDVDFWVRARGVSTQLLKDFKQPVFSVHHFFLNGVERYPPVWPCYGYYFPDSDHTKLYCPTMPKGERWIASNTSTDDVWSWQGSHDTGTAIITSGYKDGSETHTLTSDADIFAFQNEGVKPRKTLDHIASHYPYVFALYDNDDPGLEAAKNLLPFIPQLRIIELPKTYGKDVDDFVIAGQGEQVSHLIRDARNRLLSGNW